MADEDLVAQIKITGGEESAADIELLSKKGGAAFDDLAASARKAARGMEDSTDTIAKNAKAAADALAEINKSKFSPQIQSGLDAIGVSATKFGTGLRQIGDSLKGTVTAAAKFGARIALVGSAAGGAAIAVALAAKGIAQAQDTQESAFEKSTKAQIENNNSMLAARTGAINFESSQRALSQQLIKGEISWTDYNKAQVKARQEYQEQIRVSRQVEAAQRDVKEANDALTKSVEDRKAYTKLVDTFGGPLTGSLISFGRQIESVHNQFITAFSPGTAALVDVISNVLGKNATAISKYFDGVAAKLRTFVSANGPAIETALTNIGLAASSIFDGIIAAAPSLLAFFNNTVVPAVKSVVGFFDSLAATINSVFGTKITGGFLILLVLITQLSGGFKLFFALIKTGYGLFNTFVGLFGIAKNTITLLMTAGLGPLALILAVVAAALIYLATTIDWKAFAASAVSAGASIVQAFTNVIAWFRAFPANLNLIFTTLWAYILLGWNTLSTAVIAAFQAVVDWFAAFPANLQTVFDALWAYIVAGWNTLRDGVIAAFKAVVDWFAAFPGNLQTIMQTVWDAIKNGFQSAFDYVVGIATGWVANIKSLIQPLLDLINKVKAAFSGVSGDASLSTGGGAVKAATGGHIRGAGTSTSDSIAAWLSNNEFVVKAKAVRKYGTGLLHMINSGKLDLGGMAKFATGGLVSMPNQPSYAGLGGLQIARASRDGGGSSKVPLNLRIGDQDYNGLMAPEEVASRLVRHANAKRVTSAGRPPGWKGN